MKNNILLMIGAVLVGLGLFGENLELPSFSLLNNNSAGNTYITQSPEDSVLLQHSNDIVDILDNSNSPSKKDECLKLSALYYDLSVLMAIDDNAIIEDTAGIREANSLAGKMLNLDIKDKYDGLAAAAKDLMVAAVGEDDVSLTEESRKKAVQAFRALSWAFYKGSR